MPGPEHRRGLRHNAALSRAKLRGRSMLFRNFRLTILVLAAGLLGACADPPPYVNVDSTGLEQLVAQGVVLYDIRRPEEWRQTGVAPGAGRVDFYLRRDDEWAKTGVVAGSELLTFADASGRVRPEFFDRFQREVPRDRPVALICRTGNRTDVLGRYLMDQLGYKQVFNVRDGITAWMREGHPVHKP